MTNVITTGTGCPVTVGAAPFSGQGTGMPGVLQWLGESQTPSSAHLPCGFQTPHLTFMEVKETCRQRAGPEPSPALGEHTHAHTGMSYLCHSRASCSPVGSCPEGMSHAIRLHEPSPSQ